jgi:hypothetical protein
MEGYFESYRLHDARHGSSNCASGCNHGNGGEMRRIEDFKIYLTKSADGKDVIYASVKFDDDGATSFYHAKTVEGGVLTEHNILSELADVQGWFYEHWCMPNKNTA